MKKRIISLMLAVEMILMFVSCGESKESKFYGRWDIKNLEANGVTFTIAELEAMGDDSMSDFYLVIKEGGKAYVHSGDEGELVDWEVTDKGITIGVRECTYSENLLLIENNGVKVFFEKTSDSQTIPLTSEDPEDDFADEVESQSGGGEEKDNTPAPQEPTVAEGSFEEINEKVALDVENTIAMLNAEYEKIVMSVDSYDQYSKNIDHIEELYSLILETTTQLCIRMREYSLEYAKVIMASNKTNDEKYDDCEEIYDNVYDDAGDDIYDKIYDDLFDNLYDAFYDGILDDAYDFVPYKEWSSVHSNEYELWSDTHSDVYEEWSDFRSDVYGFWSDMRSELWSDDIERAEKKIEKFQKEVDKLKGNNNQTNSSAESNNADTSVNETVPKVGTNESISAEFKASMDAYEAFFDDYIAFMEKYSEEDDSSEMLTDYLTFMAKYATAMSELDEINTEDLSTEEFEYYTQVMLRINQKLLEVG